MKTLFLTGALIASVSAIAQCNLSIDNKSDFDVIIMLPRLGIDIYMGPHDNVSLPPFDSLFENENFVITWLDTLREAGQGDRHIWQRSPYIYSKNAHGMLYKSGYFLLHLNYWETKKNYMWQAKIVRRNTELKYFELDQPIIQILPFYIM